LNEANILTGNIVQVCSDSAYSINCIRSWAANWEKKGWKKSGGEIKNLEIIQDCYAIYRRIEEKLKLTHVAASEARRNYGMPMPASPTKRKSRLPGLRRSVTIAFPDNQQRP
jgi:ribonuclease HI